MVTILEQPRFKKKFISIMLLIMNSWKKCQEPEKRNTVRKRGGFSSKFCVKGGKVNFIDFDTRKPLKMYKTVKA